MQKLSISSELKLNCRVMFNHINHVVFNSGLSSSHSFVKIRSVLTFLETATAPVNHTGWLWQLRSGGGTLGTS